jgi:hypothetical protein
MDLRGYLASNHPLVLKEWEMYQRRNRLPTVGSIVATLFNMFAGALPRNTQAHVIGYLDHRIRLQDRETGFEFTVSKEFWWQEVYIVEESQ